MTTREAEAEHYGICCCRACAKTCNCLDAKTSKGCCTYRDLESEGNKYDENKIQYDRILKAIDTEQKTYWRSYSKRAKTMDLVSAFIDLFCVIVLCANSYVFPG